MINFLKLSKYHITVIAIYIVVVPLLIFLIPYRLNYNILQNKNIGLTIFFLSVFISLFFWKPIKGSKLKNTKFILTIIYASLFALPEEILFRGVIQNYFETITRGFVSILISSFLFGAAHLLNGAKGFSSKNWNWKFSVIVFFAGLPLGCLFLITDSLLLPTLLHIIYLEEVQLSQFKFKLKIKTKLNTAY